jgi:hypothetical protein
MSEPERSVGAKRGNAREARLTPVVLCTLAAKVAAANWNSPQTTPT